MKTQEKSFLIRFNKSRFLGFFILFLISRLYVIQHPPYVADDESKGIKGYGYSDVKHDSERYANIWYYGLTPYLEVVYEYPPAAIPLVYVPLVLDLQGIGNYYLNYRVQIFLFECFFFLLLMRGIDALPIGAAQKNLALIFYITAGLVGKDYWYDGLDLMFIGTFATGWILRYITGYTKMWHKICFWTAIWLSVAIKLMTAPLMIPFFILGRKRWKEELAALGIGCLIVWGVPVGYFRSSLAVIAVFHGERPLKYGSFGTFIIKAINDFTQSERVSDIAPHFPMVGPVSEVVERLVGISFPIFIFGLIIYLSLLAYRISKTNHCSALRRYQFGLNISLIYIFVLFLTTKVFSSPFHIWYILLLAMYPFKYQKSQILVLALALWMLMLDTSQLIQVNNGVIFEPLRWQTIRDMTRFLPMGLLLYWIPRLYKYDVPEKKRNSRS